ncbi:hypothetical protein CIL05_10575 [Virgibacillus profundi]|uniref:Putative amidase domain-containing protein n=1 Tax=Virgibacillus profundi TaxID=2024555 RepID=A0A2A2IF70_9BACI|nr:amidase domain-containing protein [Virgibacillus profundi]PAV29800.1 hypothetical protein CIL05_10575 [Virgibacillus profundi]PXY53972.1 hypothetical protein CIT14_10680 [Virgibacillus profundi]
MEKLKRLWLDFFQSERTADWWGRKKDMCKKRDTEIVRIQGDGHIFSKIRYDNEWVYHYLLHVSFFMKQGDHFHLEEQVIPYQFRLKNGEVVNHKEIEPILQQESAPSILPDDTRNDLEERFSYDRQAAVQYAERWWNSYNPDYRKFDVDCTNYISQCLRAGGAPMHGAPDRSRGWWYSGDNWSFSWAVAHSLRWYLSGSTKGLQGKEVQSAEELIPGDVICYDFQGDGRWDHNTIVVAKDAYGMPLVNAHTDNSRNRYWSYEDSTAWTSDIQYKFFRIGE